MVALTGRIGASPSLPNRGSDSPNPTRNGPGENGIRELLSWMTQRDTSLSYIRKSKRIFATCKLTQISWHSSWYARTVPQNSLESEVLGGQAKTIMRLGGTCADHKRWPLCRTQVKHGNQGISINITPGASRVFLTGITASSA